MTGADKQLLIGVDGGGTGCRAAIAQANGSLLATSEGGPANYTSDPEGAVRNVSETLMTALGTAGLSRSDLSDARAHFGLAGVLADTPTSAIAQHFPMKRITVSDDRLTSVRGAIGAGDGIVVSVGTGSFVAFQKDGAARFIGGWGLNIGDQASGAWLGRTALERCVLASDGVLGNSRLLETLLNQFENDPIRITRFASQARPHDYARFAPDVLEAAENGDTHGVSLMREGADYLTACLALSPLSDEAPVYLIGSIGPRYQPYLDARVQSRLATPQGSALDGALALARTHLESETS